MNAMWKRFVVTQTQRALLLREGSFVRVLAPGVHRMFNPLNRYAVQSWNVQAPHFDHPLTETLRRDAPQIVAAHFQAMDTGDNQVGLRFENDVLVEILPPGVRRLYWRGPIEMRLELRELADGAEVPAAVARQMN